MDEASDVQLLQRAVDEYAASVAVLEQPSAQGDQAARDGTAADRIEVVPTGSQPAVDPDAQPATATADGDAAHNAFVQLPSENPPAAEPAGSLPALRRAEPLHLLPPPGGPPWPPPALPLPEARQLHLHPQHHQLQQQPQGSQLRLQPSRSAVAAFLASLSPAEKGILLSSMPQERLQRLVASLPPGDARLESLRALTHPAAPAAAAPQGALDRQQRPTRQLHSRGLWPSPVSMRFDASSVPVVQHCGHEMADPAQPAWQALTGLPHSAGGYGDMDAPAAVAAMPALPLPAALPGSAPWQPAQRSAGPLQRAQLLRPSDLPPLVPSFALGSAPQQHHLPLPHLPLPSQPAGSALRGLPEPHQNTDFFQLAELLSSQRSQPADAWTLQPGSPMGAGMAAAPADAPQQAVLQWLARQNSSRSQTSAEAGSAADGSSGRRAPALERPLTEKQFVMTHKLFPVVGLLLRRVRRKVLGKVQLPPPHRPGDGVAVLHRVLGGPNRVPTCITLEQRQRLQAMLTQMEAWWAANIGRLNDLVRSARTILASNDPATVPASTAIHSMQARMQGTAEAIAMLLQLPDAPSAASGPAAAPLPIGRASKRRRTVPSSAFGELERGSPEDEARWRAVMESKALDGRQLMAEWVLEHFDHPFPLPEEKDMLSRLTGLPRAQVSNWFVNHRGRVWQPLVIQLGQEIEEEEQQEAEAAAAAAAAGQSQQGFGMPQPLQGGLESDAAEAAAMAAQPAAGLLSAQPGSQLRRQPSDTFWPDLTQGGGALGLGGGGAAGLPWSPSAVQPWSAAGQPCAQHSLQQRMQCMPQRSTGGLLAPAGQPGSPLAALLHQSAWLQGSGPEQARQLQPQWQPQREQSLGGTAAVETQGRGWPPLCFQQPAAADTPAAHAAVQQPAARELWRAPQPPSDSLHAGAEPDSQHSAPAGIPKGSAAASPAEPARAAERTSPGHRQPPPSPPSPPLSAEAAERLSGSPLLGSLLTALRRSSRSPAASSGHPAASPELSGSSGGRRIARKSADAGPGLGADADAARSPVQQLQPAADRLASRPQQADVSPDVARLIDAALATVGGSQKGDGRNRPQRLSPQTPETQPTRSQQSQEHA